MPANPDALTCPCECHGHGPGYPCTIEGGCGHLHAQARAAELASAGHGPSCVGCGRPTGAGDGAYLCVTCTKHLRQDLEEVPELVAELDVTRTKQDRIGNRSGSRSNGREQPLGYRPAALEAADVLHVTLAAWCRDVAIMTDRPLLDVPAEDPVACAAFLLRDTEAIRHAAGAGACLDEVRFAVRVGFRAIDRPAEKVYAGRCTCGTDLYGFLFRREIVCPGCEVTYRTEERRAEMLNALREHLATAAEIAAGIGELYGEPINRKRINQWHSRGRLVEHGVTLDSHDPLFRIGDVLDLAVATPTTRPKEDPSRTAPEGVSP